MFCHSWFQSAPIRGILSGVMKMDANSRLIGKRIKFRREAAGLSQEQLAERLELSKNHISSIECGKSMVTTKGLLALCDVLGGTPNYYLIGELSPEADSITSLIRLLNPAEQKTLIRLLNAYLEQEQASVPKSKGTSE